LASKHDTSEDHGDKRERHQGMFASARRQDRP
jgi:hypothetical protein